jgi:hypothetical protein
MTLETTHSASARQQLLACHRAFAGEAPEVFHYEGPLDQKVVSDSAEMLKQKLAGAENAKIRKVFSSFVEIVQNALHYSPDLPDNGGEKVAAVSVIKDNDHFRIVCGNLVENQYVPRIKQKIEPLLQMSIDEIKAAYRQQLKNDAHSEQDPISKGAGLGFLTMARDATAPIRYQIVDSLEQNEALALFYIEATI